MSAMAQRTAVFIDGAHFSRSMRKGYDRAPNVGYPELCELLTPAGGHLVGAYYYDALPYVGPGATTHDLALASSKRRFFDALRRRDVTVRVGRVARESVGARLVDKQKLVDVLLATDLVWLAAKGEIDVAVLVTGDSDFVPAVELARAEGVRVRLVRTEWARNTHPDLVRIASELVILDRSMLWALCLPRAAANDNAGAFDPWEDHPPRKGKV